MLCEGKLKLWSHITNYCLIEVVTKAGMTVSNKSYLWFPTVKVEILLLDECTCSAYTHTSGAGTAQPSGASEFTPGF